MNIPTALDELEQAIMNAQQSEPPSRLRLMLTQWLLLIAKAKRASNA
jgi:hypothetical protein